MIEKRSATSSDVTHLDPPDPAPWRNVTADERDHLLGDYLARADAAGRVIVHAVDADVLAHIRRAGGSVMTAMTVGVDLAESADTRTRRAGHNLIGGSRG